MRVGRETHHLLVDRAVVEVGHRRAARGAAPTAPRPCDRATRTQGPNQAVGLRWCVADPARMAAEDPGLSSSTMVTAHHDAQSPGRRVLAPWTGVVRRATGTPPHVAVFGPGGLEPSTGL